MMRVLAILWFVVGCRRTESVTAEPWTRAQWLAAADEFIADPREHPATFAKLVSTDAWRTLDRQAFTEPELLRFFPTYKKIVLALAANGRADDVVDLSLYGLDVYRSFGRAADDFIDHLPDGDTSRENRRAGIDKMRLAAAMEICGLLYTGVGLAPERRRALVAKLSEPARYSFLTPEALQLILATLDEKLLPSGAPYRAIRDVVASELAKRASRPGPRVTYQGIEQQTGAMMGRIVSTTGKFSVETGLAALAKRVEKEPLEHWIMFRDGDITFDAVCFDNTAASTLAETFERMDGVRVVASDKPGRWLATHTDKRDVRMRIMTLGDRGCLASVEGPSAQFSEARADAFLRSLAPAP